MGAPAWSRRLSSVLVAVTLAASACSVSESLPLPDCQEDGSVLIVAQSVPSAQLSLCLGEADPQQSGPGEGAGGGPLPSGWERSSVAIDQDGTTIRLDSDRAGAGAAVLHFATTCDIGEAVSVPSDHEAVETFEFIGAIEPGLRAQRYHLFDGGCVWWDFDFDDHAPTALAVELESRLFLVDRELLEESVRESFLDEEL